MTSVTSHTSPGGRVRIITRPVLTLLLIMVSFSFDFVMFMSVGPRLVGEAGAPALAGLLTATFLLAAVVARWYYPHIEARIPSKPLGVIAVALMGVGALFFFVINTSPVPMFIAALFRGVGFGVITVLASALIIAVSAPEVRGRVSSLIGIFNTLSSVLAPVVGLSLLDAGLLSAPGALAAGCGLLAALLLLTLSLPSKLETPPADPSDTLTHALKNPQVLSNVLVLLLCSIAWAGAASFMPLVLDPATNLPAQAFLMLFFLFMAVSRLICGQLQDKRGVSATTLIYAVLGISVAMVIVGFSENLYLTAAAAILAGLCMGWMQNMTFYAVMSAQGHSSFVLAAAWGNGIDAGGVIGALALSAVAALVGLSFIPLAIAILGLTALVPVLWMMRLEQRGEVTVPTPLEDVSE